MKLNAYTNYNLHVEVVRMRVASIDICHHKPCFLIMWYSNINS